MRLFRKPGRSFERGELFRDLCIKAFKECDTDNSGCIDIKELHIGLLILYDKINSMLPIHYPIPNKQEIGALMSRFDVDSSCELDFEEFYKLARSQMGFNKREWYRSIWFRVLNRWAQKVVIWPSAGVGAKKGLIALGVPYVGGLPTAVVAYALEAGVRSVASLR